MKKIQVFIGLIIILSCNAQDRVDPIEKFESELNGHVSKEFRQHSPFAFSESSLAGSSFYASFELLGNSGSEVLFDLDSEKLKIIDEKLKTYIRLDNSNLQSDKYHFVYDYKGKSIFLPDAGEDWKDILGKTNLKTDTVEIYLIKEDEIENVFKEESNSSVYRFSCGFFLFRKMNKLIYWFAIIK